MTTMPCQNTASQRGSGRCQLDCSEEEELVVRILKINWPKCLQYTCSVRGKKRAKKMRSISQTFISSTKAKSPNQIMSSNLHISKCSQTLISSNMVVHVFKPSYLHALEQTSLPPCPSRDGRCSFFDVYQFLIMQFFKHLNDAIKYWCLKNTKYYAEYNDGPLWPSCSLSFHILVPDHSLPALKSHHWPIFLFNTTCSNLSLSNSRES